ncbi:reticulon-4-interacting protein 1 homolog, mitochondrial [Daktulosphaira vitifoliae]|uniref:reticulon-4-interacting protein 1 homolog, mitochondrial n=1 Tax=Daktulosphaira vitifoliae TaxID=58002 RepID=UPI0021AA9863|nr:reticulon-4-interacting protein 1 homolog, mitochondrial [Daktulosphaira vitifoliae]
MSNSIPIRLVVYPLLRNLSHLEHRVTSTQYRQFSLTNNMAVTADLTYAPVLDDQTISASWSPKMIAWQLHSYGNLDDLLLTSNARSPVMTGAKDVIVRVKASSINPLDVMMTEGYGQVILGTIRQAQQKSLHKPVEFPLTLGRDFTGEIVAKGPSVTNNYNIGDIVMGVVPPFQQGCHAEYVSVPESLIAKKPVHMSYEEAAGLLYTGLTVYSALKVAGGLYILDAASKNVLVIGGSGGVGNCAIQLLKSWGSKVTTTCNTDAIKIVEKLGPDNIVDYNSSDMRQKLEEFGKYDIILDAAGIPYEDISVYTTLLKGWTCSCFITLRSPILKNTDSYGLLGGMLKNAYDLVVPNILSGAVFKGSTIRWGTFMPLEGGVRELAKLAEEKKITVPIDTVYKFMDFKEAYNKVNEGHLRGKVIVTYDQEGLDTARLSN